MIKETKLDLSYPVDAVKIGSGMVTNSGTSYLPK